MNATKDRISQEEKYHNARFAPYIGAKVIGMVMADITGDGAPWDMAYGLTIETPDGKKFHCFPLQDPEGNGPGHLDIEAVDE